ncbi:MAG: hypothetical protein MUF23_05100 [Pirellula sp.]|jgi:hypothetical protein|nr:hypothetical protein [Pirellula sp.]
MQEYSIQRSQRRCHSTDRPFGPGESYYSAVLVRGGELRRMDLASDAWTGPPEGALGWWKCRIPEKRRGALKPAPAHVLLSTLETLSEEGNQPVLSYLLALLLVRRKILTEPATHGTDDAPNPSLLHLVHAPSQREFWIPVCEPSLDACQAYHDQLTRLLFSEE